MKAGKAGLPGHAGLTAMPAGGVGGRGDLFTAGTRSCALALDAFSEQCQADRQRSLGPRGLR